MKAIRWTRGSKRRELGLPVSSLSERRQLGNPSRGSRNIAWRDRATEICEYDPAGFGMDSGRSIQQWVMPEQLS